MKILDILIEKELLHIFPKNNTTCSDIENLFDDAFLEVGASGQSYNRTACIETVRNRSKSVRNEKWKTENFMYQEISEHCYLLTYTLIQEKESRVTKRSSIWRYINEQWKILYHQGTIVLKN